MNKETSPAPKVSELKAHTGFWLRFVSNHVSHAFARKLEAGGVPGAEWGGVGGRYGKEKLAPSAVAAETGLTRGAISKLVDRLLAKKLLTREEDGDDRRYQVIALTERGRQLVPKLAAKADEN